MMRLLMSEWQRLWARKVIWLLFAVVPVMVFGTARYFLQANEQTDVHLPQYAVFGNFSVLSFEEMLLTAFQLFVTILTAFVVTDEYRSGQLRMVMLRAYTFGQLFWAKMTIVLTVLLLLVGFYFVCSYAVGYWMFPHADNIPLFYHSQTVNTWGAVPYNLAFYGLGFVNLIAMTGVMMFIAVVSHTTTAAIGAGLGFYLFSLFYPLVSSYVMPLFGEQVYMRLYFSSLPMIAWQGVVFMLAETPRFVGWILSVMGVYLFVFGGLAYWTFTRKDRWV